MATWITSGWLLTVKNLQQDIPRCLSLEKLSYIDTHSVTCRWQGEILASGVNMNRLTEEYI